MSRGTFYCPTCGRAFVRWHWHKPPPVKAPVRATAFSRFVLWMLRRQAIAAVAQAGRR
jgi:hypothetical protein